MSPKEVAHGALDAWNNRDFDRMRELLHPDYTYAGGDGQEQKGPEAGLAVAKMFANAFPDGRVEILNAKEVGDTAFVEFIGRGSHGGDLMGIAPTGRPVNIPICEVTEVRDGKVYRVRQYLDFANVMAQLGVTTVPSAAPA